MIEDDGRGGGRGRFPLILRHPRDQYSPAGEVLFYVIGATKLKDKCFRIRSNAWFVYSSVCNHHQTFPVTVVPQA